MKPLKVTTTIETKKPTMEELYRLNPEMRDTAKLHDILMRDAKRPVVMTVAEFEKFLPIFQNHPNPDEIVNLPPSESNKWDQYVDKLTAEYTARVNLYKEVYVYEKIGDPQPVLIIPPTLMPMASIRPDPSSEQAVSQFRKDGGSDIPRNAQRAEAGIMEAFKRAHNSKENIERCRAIREHTRNRFDDWKRKKQAVLSGQPLKSVVSSSDPKIAKAVGSASYDKAYLDNNTEDEFL